MYVFISINVIYKHIYFLFHESFININPFITKLNSFMYITKMCTCTSLLKKNNEIRVGDEHKAFQNACMYHVKFEFYNELSMLRQ